MLSQIVLFILCLSTCNSLTPSGSGGIGSRREVIKKGVEGIVSANVLAESTFASPPVVSPSINPLSTPLTIRNGKAMLPKMGVGAWAWGDSLFWGYNPKEDAELEEVFRTATERGVGFFDTAELYGIGRSETLIKDFTSRLTPELASGTSVATKFAALPWRTKRGDVVKAAKDSVRRLGRPIDLYQIHFPNAYANEAYWDGLGDAYEQGLVKAVGVSNYGKEAVRACHASLARRGIPLSSNQIQMSLLYRSPLDNGLKSTCDELGVQTIAYSPLALGLLTGKYR